jgi:hypothetical protein
MLLASRGEKLGRNGGKRVRLYGGYQGLLHVALGAYCALLGLGVLGRPRRRDDDRPARRQPGFVWGGVVIMGFGLWLAAKGLTQPPR